MNELRNLPKLKGNTEQKMCGAKTRHITEKLARQEKKKIFNKTGDVVNVYQCPYCHYYHVGRGRVN